MMGKLIVLISSLNEIPVDQILPKILRQVKEEQTPLEVDKQLLEKLLKIKEEIIKKARKLLEDLLGDIDKTISRILLDPFIDNLSNIPKMLASKNREVLHIGYPERNLAPQQQAMFSITLSKMVEHVDKTVIIATHSPYIVAGADNAEVYYVHYDENGELTYEKRPYAPFAIAESILLSRNQL